MKKKYVLVVAWVLFMLPAFSQNIAINADASLPNPNAILDIKSGNKGLLIPRMDSVARRAIPYTKGLLVYDTTTSSFWYNTGSQWQNMAASTLAAAALTATGPWLLTGNSGTTDSVNFLGTTDNVPLSIRVNNQLAGRVDHLKNNTFWGYLAGLHNGSGSFNTAIGSASLQANTTGNGLTATGFQALNANTTGFSNAATGYQALMSNTTGNNNTAHGYETLKFNSTGAGNTALGSEAVYGCNTGSYNTGAGYAALRSVAAASNNTAYGSTALASTRADNNTGVGSGAMYSNTTGDGNVSFGYQSLYSLPRELLTRGSVLSPFIRRQRLIILLPPDIDPCMLIPVELIIRPMDASHCIITQ